MDRLRLTSPPRSAVRGFTLIEILVVVLIVSIISAVAVFSLRDTRGDTQIKEEARRIATLLQLASEEAAMQGRDLGVRFRPESYGFLLYEPELQNWVTLDYDRLLREREVPEGIVLTLKLDDVDVELPQAEEDQLEPPQVLILSSGETTPFELEIESDNSDYVYYLTGQPLGGVEIEWDERRF
ncbi:MAG: type II secretion system minor pseudopilin GspH [Pseudomonadota bacterium]